MITILSTGGNVQIFEDFGFIYSDLAKPTDTFITDKKGQTKRFTKTQAKQLGLIK